MKLALALMVLSAGLCGCGQSPTAKEETKPGYQLLIAPPDSVVYEINKSTGEVLLIKGKISYPVKPQMTADDLLKGLTPPTNSTSPNQ